MFKNLRIKVFNWFAAGKLTLTQHNKEKSMATTYTIGGGLGLGNGSLNHIPQPQAQQMQLGNSTINFNVTKANGGWIVQINPQNYNVLLSGHGETKQAELYLIHDDEDFDSALGKIVTTTCLKG